MKNEKKYNKELLDLEVVIGAVSVAMFFAVILIASFAEIPDVIRVILLIIAAAFLFAIAFALLKMEQIVGYYKCAECGHKYVPTYKAIFLAMHMGRTRHLTCPKCHKKSWQKKVTG
jgi:DNA-directed RNA polymerase subunit RPC12/RpoP